VDDRGSDSDVDEAVEALPGFAAHGSQDEGRAGKGESEQDDPGKEADLDEATLSEIVPDGGPDEMPLGEELSGMAGGGGVEGAGEVVAGEEKDVRGEVEGGVEEGVEADQAAEAHKEPKTRGEAAQGCDGERAEQNPERPISGEVSYVVNWVGVEGEVAVAEDVQQPGKGAE